MTHMSLPQFIYGIKNGYQMLSLLRFNTSSMSDGSRCSMADTSFPGSNLGRTAAGSILSLTAHATRWRLPNHGYRSLGIPSLTCARRFRRRTRRLANLGSSARSSMISATFFVGSRLAKDGHQLRGLQAAKSAG